MSTFVLVHGAWHGGWCWQRVRRRLQAAGHEVFTPTLTGLADRSHLLTPAIDLSTHIRDVASLVEWEGLDDIVLCGHSYGGCVVTGVADLLHERIAALVYLDAFVPASGRSLHQSLPPALAAAQLESARLHGEGWKVPPLPAAHYALNADDAAWAEDLFTMQPLATLTEPLVLTHPTCPLTDVTYVLATGYPNSPFGPYHAKAVELGWKTVTLDGGHDLMLDCPGDVCGVLQDTAAAAGTGPEA